MVDKHTNTISFAERVTASASFGALFAEGMKLVEETSIYLDGAGKRDAKALPRPACVLYTAESMRLTTRLMQMAGWLLMERAINAGEMTRERGQAERTRMRLDGLACDRSTVGWNDLPAVFQDLVERSLRLRSRITLLDREIYRRGTDDARQPAGRNSIETQIGLLKTAFRGC